MANSLSYDLVLCDDSENIIKGGFEYSLVDNNEISIEKGSKIESVTSSSTTEVSTFEITGTIKLPEVTGQDSISVNGIAYVSMMGPPIASMVSAQIDMKLLSMEFNFIESNGAHIGGGLSYAAEPMKPAKVWSVLGKKTS
ncbi:MAG: hypothetical protein D6B28_05685 [Gammaproteobacteria bacterium]|mgnify:CR=1 FL=1|nr:MAG: hypothetical protein D6B28_05685 [Gammaproteobacteria bacterium]